MFDPTRLLMMWVIVNSVTPHVVRYKFVADSYSKTQPTTIPLSVQAYKGTFRPIHDSPIHQIDQRVHLSTAEMVFYRILEI